MEKERPAAGKKATWIRICVLLALLGVFIFAGVKLGMYYIGSKQAASEYESLADLKESIVQQQKQEDNSSEDSSSENSSSEELPETGNTMLPEYRVFYDMNQDMVGWLHIPGTRVDYPVMQTVDTPNYYLKRNFYKKSSDWGAIYAREQCDVNTPSDNVVLYGHAMKDGSMFATLNRYGTKAFWQEHPTFSFDTLYAHYEYEIWAVFKTNPDGKDGFPYHRYNEFSSEEEFNDFVQTVKDLAFFDTGITPEYGDKLLTLSTCEYTLENGRFVVCAVRITQG